MIADLPEEERKAFRQRLSKPKLVALKTWLDEQAPLALPKSALGEAIEYCLNRWDALCLFVEHGNLQIDNNVVEAGMKPVAIGRSDLHDPDPDLPPIEHRSFRIPQGCFHKTAVHADIADRSIPPGSLEKSSRNWQRHFGRFPKSTVTT